MGEAEGRRSKRGDSNVLEHLPRTHRRRIREARLQACRCTHTRIYIRALRARWRLGNGRFSTGHQIARRALRFRGCSCCKKREEIANAGKKWEGRKGENQRDRWKNPPDCRSLGLLLSLSLCFSRLFATIFERGKTGKEKVWTLVETPIERLPAETPCFAINGYSVPRTRSSFYRLNWFTFVPCFLSL